MADVVIYDPNSTLVPNRVTQYLRSVDTPAYTGVENTLVNPDLTNVVGVNHIYWKYDAPDLVVMSAAEQTLINDQIKSPPIDLIRILEEDDNVNRRTQGHFKAVSVSFPVAGGIGNTTEHVFDFPYDISLLSVQLPTDMMDMGDILTTIVAENTVVGALTADVAIGETVLPVSETVTDKMQKGWHVSLTDGTNTEDLGHVLAVDKVGGTITTENATTFAFAAATPTFVRFSVHILEKLVIPSITGMITIGDKKIGSSFLPANTPVTIKYTNNHIESKTFTAIIEILF